MPSADDYISFPDPDKNIEELLTCFLIGKSGKKEKYGLRISDSLIEIISQKHGNIKSQLPT